MSSPERPDRSRMVLSLWCLLAPAMCVSLAPAAPATAPALGDKGRPLIGDSRGSKRIVFVVDYSGSMLNRIANVKGELHDAIEQFTPSTSFDLIAYNWETKVFSDKIIPADGDAKRRAYSFMDETTVGDVRGISTDPLSAMRAALQLEPDRICLVSGGKFPREVDFAAKVCQLTGPKPVVRIDSLAWVQGRADLTPFVSLRLISHHTGGTFTCVTEEGAKDLTPFDRVEERDLPHAKPKPAEYGSEDGMTRVELAGLTSPATAVAFVYDRSLPAPLRQRAEAEILRSTRRLDKSERLSVIRYASEGAPLSFAQTLVLAVPDNLRRVAAWIGEDKPFPADAATPAASALELAFRQHAEAIYWLYGPGADLNAMRAKLAEWNKRSKSPVRIYPVAVVDRAPKDPQTVMAKVDDMEFTLPLGPVDGASRLPRAIAEESGGTFTYLGPAEDRAGAASRPAPLRPDPPPAPRTMPRNAEPTRDGPRAEAPVDQSASIFGDSGDVGKADRVVFLCGCFHVMLQKTSWPKDQLQRAIENLKPSQSEADRRRQRRDVPARNREGDRESVGRLNAPK